MTKPAKKTNLLLSAIFALSVNLVTPDTAYSEMDFGNMNMPSMDNWMPSSPSNWSNQNQRRGGPPPPGWNDRNQQGGGSDGWQNGQQQQPRNQRSNRSGPSAQKLKKIKTLLHLTPEQESAWTEYTNSLTPTKSQKPQQSNNRGEQSSIEKMEQRVQRMEQRLNQQKAKLTAHKKFLATLDEKQAIIFDLLSKQSRQQGNLRKRGQRGQGGQMGQRGRGQQQGGPPPNYY